jgi:hypothetical protein
VTSSSKRKPKSWAEDRALASMREHGFPMPVRNYQFDKERRWKFDFAWPHRTTKSKFNLYVALEIEGLRGRHTTVSGYTADCEKYNAAQIQGWLVIRIPTSMLSNDEWLITVFDALKTRGGIE